MTILGFIFLNIISLTWAKSPLDEQLAQYVEKFQLASLETPVQVNKKLYDLGHLLFTDTLLSGNKNITCRDCHHPRNMTMDALPLGLGEGAKGIQIGGNLRQQLQGKILARNTPALFNLDGVDSMFWDGRIFYDRNQEVVHTPLVLKEEVKNTLKSALAAQAIFPLVDHAEMRGQKGSNEIADAPNAQTAWEEIVKRVLNETHYQKAFAEIYPGEVINIGHIGQALAEFQRAAFFYANTPYDQYLKGNDLALTEIQKMGMNVFFGKGKCGECHRGPHLSNFEFHNIGVPQIGPGKNMGDDLGRYSVTKKSDALYAFRVPPLRNVAMTQPYMHDGAFKTIPQVIEHYDMIREGLKEFSLVNNWKNYFEKIQDHNHQTDELRIANLSPKLTTRLHLTEEDEKALAEFLETGLTDKRLTDLEIVGNYQTHFRLQLTPQGHAKLEGLFPGIITDETYYYFDALFEDNFFLRELSKPIKLFILKDEEKSSLQFRELAHKSATSLNGVVMGSQFNKSESITLDPEVFAPLETSFLDIFERIYIYNDGNRSESIPTTELSIIKSNVNHLNKLLKLITFQGIDIISDHLNLPKDEILLVPTSFNHKKTQLFELQIQSKKVLCRLQESLLRDEWGGQVKTWAIEIETSKILKSELESFSKALLQELKLDSSDVGGTSPSPSKLTLKVLRDLNLK